MGRNSSTRPEQWPLARNELVRPLTGLVFHPAGCRATLLTNYRLGGGIRFSRRKPDHVAGGTGLHVTSSRAISDPTMLALIRYHLTSEGGGG